MNNIVVVGLKYDLNIGDQAIFFTTKKIVEEYVGSNNLDVELREIDIYGETKFRTERNFFDKARNKLLRKRYSADDIREMDVRRLAEKQITEETKCIVFTGGGIVKYKYQLAFLRAIDVVTARADKLGIPVMLSGVGVEGYDETNKDCQRLKAVLNRKCVRCITTRDDLESLKKYCDESEIILAKVADPACGISRYIKCDKAGDKTIGLGVVREGLFTDNDIDINKQQLLDLYSALYLKITGDGYKCFIYTNGLKQDQKFAEDLKEYIKVNHGIDAEVLPRPDSPATLIEYINGFQGIICGRLHSSIIAYSYDVPSVGLVWNNKQILFGENIGYPERFITSDHFNADHIGKTLYKAMDEGYKVIDRNKYIDTTGEYVNRFLKEAVCGNING